jgi:hypothetical protein
MVKGKTEQSFARRIIFENHSISLLRCESIIATPDPLLSLTLLGTSKG